VISDLVFHSIKWLSDHIRFDLCELGLIVNVSGTIPGSIPFFWYRVLNSPDGPCICWPKSGGMRRHNYGPDRGSVGLERCCQCVASWEFSPPQRIHWLRIHCSWIVGSYSTLLLSSKVTEWALSCDGWAVVTHLVSLASWLYHSAIFGLIITFDRWFIELSSISAERLVIVQYLICMYIRTYLLVSWYKL
jgi:hypothetical protein